LAATITILRPGARHTILVAERDPVERCIVCDRLRDEGYRVLESHSAAATASILANRPVHLLLIDVTMEIRPGEPSLARLAAGLQPALIVIATGTRDAVSRALSCNPDLFDAAPIEKPIFLPKLLDRIREHLMPAPPR
jgi:DNA-binding response OmpR family regulator